MSDFLIKFGCLSKAWYGRGSIFFIPCAGILFFLWVTFVWYCLTCLYKWNRKNEIKKIWLITITSTKLCNTNRSNRSQICYILFCFVVVFFWKVSVFMFFFIFCSFFYKLLVFVVLFVCFVFIHARVDVHVIAFHILFLE